MDELSVLVFNWRDLTNPNAGGAEVHIHQVLKRLVKWGHSATLFCGQYRGCKKKEEIDGIEIIRSGNQYTVYLAALKYYLKKPKSFDAVIDDINGVPFFTPLYVKEHKIAIIHHLVKDIFFKELPFLPAFIGYAAEQIIPLIYKRIPIITVSESSKLDLIKFGIPKDNIIVIHNGIDSNPYETSDYLKSPFPHVLYLGRLKRYKNLEQLIIATKYVTEKLPNVKLSIAGEGDKDYKFELKKLAEELNLTNIIFHGFVTSEEKLELMQKAWVFVTTSEREGWGLTVIEANSYKTPAIVTDVQGLRDTVKNGETGFIIPYGKPKALAKAITKVLTDNELRERLSKNAIKWSRKFNWDKTASKILQVIKKTIA